jgi:pyridoxal phosphate enzyme (YggS family)
MTVDIARNIAEVRRKIKFAAEKSGRREQDICLIAVSKTRTAEEITEAISAGAEDLGENKVQEIMDKYAVVSEKTPPDHSVVKWHLIGHLQRNKVKYIIDKVELIHSVDSFRLADEIDKRAEAIGRVADVLLQVNPAEEESKFGVSLGDVVSLTEEMLTKLPNVRIKGLMTVVPEAENPEDIRVFFRAVRELFDSLKEKAPHERLDMEYLSMGMTHDFEVAIEEGANMVRVGTGIFGPRNYTNV